MWTKLKVNNEKQVKQFFGGHSSGKQFFMGILRGVISLGHYSVSLTGTLTGGFTWNEGKYLFWIKSPKNPFLEFKHLLWKEISRMHFTSIGACRKCVFVMRLSSIYYIMIFLFNRANYLSMLLSQLLQLTLLIVRNLH